MIYLNKECPQDIANILYNQIVDTIMCSKKLDQYFELNANSNNDSNKKII
jgi:hypothetical protein